MTPGEKAAALKKFENTFKPQLNEKEYNRVLAIFKQHPNTAIRSILASSSLPRAIKENTIDKLLDSFKEFEKQLERKMQGQQSIATIPV